MCACIYIYTCILVVVNFLDNIWKFNINLILSSLDLSKGLVAYFCAPYNIIRVIIIYLSIKFDSLI